MVQGLLLSGAKSSATLIWGVASIDAGFKRPKTSPVLECTGAAIQTLPSENMQHINDLAL